MYLNPEEMDGVEIIHKLEPLHRMYLNSQVLKANMKIVGLEPLHRMYLNVPVNPVLISL